MLHQSALSMFIDAITAEGLTPPEEINTDGTLYRFSSNGKLGDKSGYYVLHNNPNGILVGIFGCCRAGVQHTWSSTPRSSLTLENKLIISKMLENSKTAIETTAKERQNYANTVVLAADAADNSHPYAKLKGGLSLKGLYWMKSIPRSEFFDNPTLSGTLDNVLIVPVKDAKEKLISLQAITGEGNKFFMSKGTTKGGMFVLEGETDTVYVAEGYATAASIHEATSKTVVCAFNANNLLVVAPTTKEIFPNAVVVVAADNDAAKEAEGKGNKGKEIALKLFEEENIAYSMPKFESVNDGSDWNDFACSNGLEALLGSLIANTIVPARSIDSFDDAIEHLSIEAEDTEVFDKALKFIDSADTLFQTRMMTKLKAQTGVPFKDMKSRMHKLSMKEKPTQLSHGEMASKLVSNAGETEW